MGLKKKWEKPKLIVLITSKSQEAVLAPCKGGIPGAPYNTAAECEQRILDCSGCSVYVES
jgi:hypothetical protein